MVGLSRLSRWMVGLAVPAVTGALLVAGNAAAATNLVTNGGFESGNTAGWSCPGTASVVTSPVHSGVHALSVAPTRQ